jgi:menaquinone-specific isochorismate synthase
VTSKKAFIKEFLRQGAIVSTSQKKILLGWGNIIKSSVLPNTNRPAFYFADYFLNDDPWHTFENNLEVTVGDFIEWLLPYATPTLSRYWHTPYKDFFRNVLDDIRKRILLQELDKAVPFIYEISPTKMTANQLAASLVQASQRMQKYPLYLYGIWQQHEGILGLTPEILFSVKSYEEKWLLHTFALAGTKDASQNSNSIMHDFKTQLEHEIVLEGIVSSLSGLGKISIGNKEYLALPYLVHLKTPIFIELDTSPQISSIISELHPTPALGAYPRIKGIQWLKHYQTLIDRKQYGAPVGYALGVNSEAHFYVAIRNVQWRPHEMRIAAGCGIVMGSRFEDEWYEVNLKIKSIKQALAL